MAQSEDTESMNARGDLRPDSDSWLHNIFQWRIWSKSSYHA